jgi:OCT family organic cation transporter-like MFS transporter 4/5
MCELFSSKMRTFAGLFLQLYWAVGMMIMAAIAYFLRDWRMLQLALSVPGLLVVGGFW